MEENSSEVSRSVPILTRRGFFKKTGAVAAGITATYVANKLGLNLGKSETLRSPEIKLNPSVKVLDFFETDNIHVLGNFPPGFSEKKAWQEMGVSDPSTREGLCMAVPKNEEQTKLLMIKFFGKKYEGHGNTVVSIMEKVAAFLHPGQNFPIPDQASIAESVELNNLEYDEIGNPTMHVNVSQDKVSKLVSESPESVINMSFQLGDFSLSYSLYDKRQKYPEMARQLPGTFATNRGDIHYKDHQGREITEAEYNEICKRASEQEVFLLKPVDRGDTFIDGYAGEKTYQNLRELIEVANSHPKKMFIAAGGNPTHFNYQKMVPDISEARVRLEKERLWPENLIIVGFETTTYYEEHYYRDRASYGADIYVSDQDLKELGFSGASSWATPVVTEVVKQLIAKGMTTKNQVKDGLMQLTRPGTYWEGPKQREYRVLDMDKAKIALAN